MKLTASQIKRFAEINLDSETSDATLMISLNYHSNAKNQILRREKDLWDELREIHGLDACGAYEIRMIDGVMCIIEQD